MGCCGFSKLDITPKIGCLLYGYVDDLVSESIHDPLFVNAFYFSDGTKKALMITADVCSINTDFSEKMREKIAAASSVPYENIMLHAIHTHTGPNTDGNTGWGELDIDYCENILLPKTLEACLQAESNAKEAMVGISIGKSDVGVNRREQNLDNNIIFGQCAWGSYDPRMAVITFTDTDKNIIASLIYYTCHGTSAGKCTAISRDFSGGMTDILAEYTSAPAAFFCGPEGDVGPRLPNGGTVGNIKDTEELGKLAGRDAVKIFCSITDFVPLSFDITDRTLVLPLKDRITENEAREIYNSFKNNYVNLDGQKRNYALRVLDSYKNGYETKTHRKIHQTALRINDVIFAAFPYELFSDIALRINKAKEGYEVFSLSNTNGSAGYFPCNSEISKGGYEVEMFLNLNIQPFADNADWYLIKETLKTLEVF